MQIYVINLDYAEERLAAVNKQLSRFGVTYTRIPAVNGRALSQDEKRNAVNRFRWWCAVGSPATDGEIGCALSHASIYRKMIDEEIQLACILEDDVILDDRFPQVLLQLEKWHEKRSKHNSVCLLSNHSDSVGQLGNRHSGYQTPVEKNDFLVKESVGDFCTECYVLTREAARQLLQVNSPLITPCDWWGRWKRIKVIELYHVFPTVAMQNKSEYSSGTIPGIISPVNELPWHLFLCHKLKRVIGVAFDRVLRTMLSR